MSFLTADASRLFVKSYFVHPDPKHPDTSISVMNNEQITKRMIEKKKKDVNTKRNAKRVLSKESQTLRGHVIRFCPTIWCCIRAYQIVAFHFLTKSLPDWVGKLIR